TNDFINTFISEYENGGLLPVWELSANETFCMIGYHSVSVITDAFMKGINDYDSLKAFEAMKHSATQDKFGLSSYRKMGYLSSDVENESVSKTLEYAYDDWCIAQMAQKLGQSDDYSEYIQRAQFYKNLFDNKTGFIRAKFNGGWYTPFDPTEVNNNYTEANCWQYTFYVPQDITSFINLLGGKKNLEKKLDELFSTNTKLTGRVQSDISGLIGQYAHGNEPSHHIAYLYDYADAPWKTQKMVRKILDELYANNIDGLSGNEDCGQMSAWFVLSAMGMYSVCPGQLDYALSSPLFDKITINLENEKEFIIIANNSSNENIYIQSAKLNGEDYNKCYLNYDSILKGGKIEFAMGPQPPAKWGTNEDDIPKTEIKDELIVPIPYFITEGKVFRNGMKIVITAPINDSKIYYTLDGREPDSTSLLYNEPFEINKSLTVKAISYAQNKKSFVTTGQFFKIPEGRTVKLISNYNSQYTAGGPDGLIDNIRGKENWRLGGWQGYQGTDFEAIVDLGKVQNIHKISAEFLQDVNSWIWMPTQIEYAISNDTTNFKIVATIKNDISDKDTKVIIKNYDYKLSKKARYVRVKAKNYGKIPGWHEGKEGQAFIFIDEISIE
ncbi:MAG: GH92 family glycosyl hydrolase, partial [FCB group bacterium]